ncbi:MAG: hypothetical protein II229_05185, partial [Clostridia bacterium]|nr:hypothetical protein [Clostridia bacterium]
MSKAKQNFLFFAQKKIYVLARKYHPDGFGLNDQGKRLAEQKDFMKILRKDLTRRGKTSIIDNVAFCAHERE